MRPSRWQRLKSLYDSAMDLTFSQRQVFVRAVPDGDLADDLRQLLRQEQSLGGFLETPVVTQLAADPNQHTFSTNEVLSERWEISDFVGAGGMGEVYRAWDRELREFVALKTLKAHSADNQLLVERLRQEVSLARRITHSNVCRLFDASRAADSLGRSVLFYTMEFLDGKPLSAEIAKEPFTLDRASQVARQLISGLAAAHKRGVIHGDLKPSNVMLSPDDDGQIRAVITDFGLAQDLSRSFRNSVVGKGEPLLFGTPAYMAPEQIQGGPVNAATDVYAFGLLIFEMLSGKLPQDGPSAHALALARLEEKAPDIRTFVPRVPALWADAISACLNRDPSLRPASIEAVGALLNPEESSSRITYARRAFLSVAATAGGISAFYLVAKKPWISVPPDLTRHLELGQEFAKRRTADGLQNAALEFERAVKLDAKSEDAWAGLADAYSAMANFNFIDPHLGLTRAHDAAARAFALAPNSGRTNGIYGYVASIDLGHWLEAEPYLAKAVRLSPQDSLVRLWYAAWLGKVGRSKEAIAQLDHGLEIDPASFVLHHQKAVELLHAERFQEMLAEAREVVRLQPYEASSYLILARALEWTAKFDEALEACTEAEKFAKNSMTAKCSRACVEAAAGNTSTASKTAVEVRDYWQHNPFQTLLLAQLLSRLARVEDVIEILLTGYERGDSSILSAPSSPYFRRWLGTPAFSRFSRKLGLRS